MLVVGYVCSPIDPIPDFIPVVVSVWLLCVALAVFLVMRVC
jgi:uncharacterized membrane protein YkvA (DUF1232 family)